MRLLIAVAAGVLVCSAIALFVAGAQRRRDSTSNLFVTEIPSVRNASQAAINCSDWPVSWKADRHARFVALLAGVDAFLHEANVSYAIADSTALGYARHNGCFIPWDDDIDIVVQSRRVDVKAITAHAKRHPVYCSAKCKYSCSLKLFPCTGKRVPGYNWSYPFVDVFASGDRASTACGVIFPAKRVTLAGVRVNAPRDMDTHLSREFGLDYMTACKARSYDHSTETRRPNVGKEAVAPCAAVLKKCGKAYPNMTSHRWRRRQNATERPIVRRECDDDDGFDGGFGGDDYDEKWEAGER